MWLVWLRDTNSQGCQYSRWGPHHGVSYGYDQAFGFDQGNEESVELLRGDNAERRGVCIFKSLPRQADGKMTWRGQKWQQADLSGGWCRCSQKRRMLWRRGDSRRKRTGCIPEIRSPEVRSAWVGSASQEGTGTGERSQGWRQAPLCGRIRVRKIRCANLRPRLMRCAQGLTPRLQPQLLVCFSTRSSG